MTKPEPQCLTTLAGGPRTETQADHDSVGGSDDHDGYGGGSYGQGGGNGYDDGSKAVLETSGGIGNGGMAARTR